MSTTSTTSTTFWNFSSSTGRVGRGGAMGANATPPPPPPQAEKVHLEGAKDEKKITPKINLSSNLPMNTAFYGVENIPEVVDHLI